MITGKVLYVRRTGAQAARVTLTLRFSLMSNLIRDKFLLY